MSLVAVTAAKGSPGASTIAWELVARWPRPIVGIECDVSGGSWAHRHGLSYEPGLVSLTASRGASSWDAVAEHGHLLGANGAVVCSSPGREVESVFSILESRLRSWPQTMDVIVDLGRVTHNAVALCRSADLVIIVGRTATEDVGSLVKECASLLEVGCRVQLVCIDSPGGHAAAEIASVCKVPLIDVLIPYDPFGVLRLARKGRSKPFDLAFTRLSRVVSDQVVFRPVVLTDEALR